MSVPKHKITFWKESQYIKLGVLSTKTVSINTQNWESGYLGLWVRRVRTIINVSIIKWCDANFYIFALFFLRVVVPFLPTKGYLEQI